MDLRHQPSDIFARQTLVPPKVPAACWRSRHENNCPGLIIPDHANNVVVIRPHPRGDLIIAGVEKLFTTSTPAHKAAVIGTPESADWRCWCPSVPGCADSIASCLRALSETVDQFEYGLMNGLRQALA